MKEEQIKSQDIPLEMQKELSNSRHPLTIGIPKEDLKKEKRLAFTPEAVDMIVDAGHEVIIEEGAGDGINYSDADYAENGAFIANDRRQVFSCDMIFKIAPPTLQEIEIMKKKSTVLSMLQMPDITVDIIKAMQSRQINAIGYELMSSDGMTFPVRNSISEIEGAASIFVASELLSNEKGGKGVLMGGVPGVSPTEVVVIGAGMAGTVATRAALALGATVKVFDNDIRKLRRLQNELKHSVFTSVFQPNVLVNAFKSADVIIGAMRYINDPVRYVISEDLIKTMKKGALIVDLRINQGGCFETTCFLSPDHPGIFEKHQVRHYCVPNISSRVARTTSMSLSNIFTPLVTQMGEAGGVATLVNTDMAFRSGFYIYGGKLVNNYVAKQFNLPSNDIGLFLSVF
ncbi:alanine dehydrogenase [Bacteroidales bacterium OttesenSCG-928-M06]|nr:alanine dehydrogenase [Bacteroidales bacterium OttesenSCG-928-M06]